MFSVADAQEIVLKHANPLPPANAPVTVAILGQILAEDIVSDLDMPPYDKAMMDGYAVRSNDVAGGQVVLSVIEEITAGQTPKKALQPGEAARIMTGAPVPEGCDAVVMTERTRETDSGHVEIND